MDYANSHDRCLICGLPIYSASNQGHECPPERLKARDRAMKTDRSHNSPDPYISTRLAYGFAALRGDMVAN